MAWEYFTAADDLHVAERRSMNIEHMDPTYNIDYNPIKFKDLADSRDRNRGLKSVQFHLYMAVFSAGIDEAPALSDHCISSLLLATIISI